VDTDAIRTAARARPEASARRRRLMAAAVAAGAVASVFYFSWWLEDGRLADPGLVVALGAALVYIFVQIYCAWFVYLHIDEPVAIAAPPGLAVDVFVPVYDEPGELVARSLAAAVAMRYPHRTYLLDDTSDPRFATLAAEVGAEYLTRADHHDAKAGNVNAALARTAGELVTVFDVDHVPAPDFLDAALGYFRDPAVGFVQSRVVFSNDGESMVARSMAAQAADAYGPTSMGMHGCGAASVWGSHCTFRRAALTAIGGHQAGLAEDLHTSVRLHAAGWRSVFVPTAHAVGLVPGDLGASVRQHFKWARGVFGVLLEAYPGLARRLSPAQNLAYLVRFTYYLIGPVFFAHALVAAWVLWHGDPTARAGFASYVLHALPLAVAVVGVRALAAALWMPSAEPRRLEWRGYTWTCALWPIYVTALAAAIARVPIPHIATPKERAGRVAVGLALPQAVLATVLLAGIVWRVAHGPTPADAVVILVAAAAAAVQLAALQAALYP